MRIWGYGPAVMTAHGFFLLQCGKRVYFVPAFFKIRQAKNNSDSYLLLSLKRKFNRALILIVAIGHKISLIIKLIFVIVISV